METFVFMTKGNIHDNQEVFIIANTDIAMNEYLLQINFDPNNYSLVFQFVYIQNEEYTYWTLIEILKKTEMVTLTIFKHPSKWEDFEEFIYALIDATSWFGTTNYPI